MKEIIILTFSIIFLSTFLSKNEENESGNGNRFKDLAKIIEDKISNINTWDSLGYNYFKIDTFNLGDTWNILDENFYIIHVPLKKDNFYSLTPFAGVFYKRDNNYISLGNLEKDFVTNRFFFEKNMVLISVYDSSFLPIFSLYLREELRLEPFPLIGIEKDSIREIKSYKACNFKSDVTKIYKCCTLLDKFNFWDMKINEFEKRYLKKI